MESPRRAPHRTKSSSGGSNIRHGRRASMGENHGSNNNRTSAMQRRLSQRGGLSMPDAPSLEPTSAAAAGPPAPAPTRHTPRRHSMLEGCSRTEPMVRQSSKRSLMMSALKDDHNHQHQHHEQQAEGGTPSSATGGGGRSRTTTIPRRSSVSGAAGCHSHSSRRPSVLNAPTTTTTNHLKTGLMGESIATMGGATIRW